MRSILILFLFSSLFLNVYCQPVLDDMPSSSLPSEETYKTIENESRAPGLRARPGDIVEAERPQKVPLVGFDFSQAALLAMSIFIYKNYNPQTRRKS